MVDWSANSTPKLGRDSIWAAVRERAGETTLTNLPTRAAAGDFLVELLDSDPRATTLVGVDFSLGFPAGTAAALGLTGTAWSAMCALLAECISDDDLNRNNRFAVAADLNDRITGGAAPFWGCPPSAASQRLTGTKPSDAGSLGWWRAVERELRSQGHRPFSSWQLLGAGAVGSQSLLGIARLHRLRERFVDRVEVWPFTTGLQAPQVGAGAIVVAEIWPSMLKVDDGAGLVRDAAQVRTVAKWLAETDECNRLASLFAPRLSPDVAAAVIAEEGWVLGVVP